MSDALCGPSNPLQQFKQQTQLDRTLQQDRLASRQSPAEGFRSANPNAGLLDPEFEAFQAGVPPAELSRLQPFQQPPQNYAGLAPAPSWAADFQQMHISSPPSFQQQRMPLQGPSTANWAQGFREHIAHAPPRAQTSASSPQQFQQMARYGGMNSFQSSFAYSHSTPGLQSKGKEPAAEQFDEAAFERAFDQARSHMLDEAEMGTLSSNDVHQNTKTADDFQESHVSDHESNVNSALQDFQLQLMLLDQQNKKQWLMTRQAQDPLQQSTSQQGTGPDMALHDTPGGWAKADYEEQLRLLDEHNKKRLMMARGELEQSSSLQEVDTEGTLSDVQQPGDYQQALLQLEEQSRQHFMRAKEESRMPASVEGFESMQNPHQVRQESMEEQVDSQERAKEDDDALAATAQELLEKVQHNQTDKFRNSEFLGLMRKLRDREVKVEGDKMVEMSNATTTGAETQTAQPLNPPSPLPRFDNSEQRPAPLPPGTVDTRPYEYGIPHEEQDHDAGRGVNPRDGQEVVDMLDQPGQVTDDIGTSAFDSSPSNPSDLFYGDLRVRNDALSEMLYGEHGTVSLPPH